MRRRTRTDPDQFLKAGVKYCGDQFFWTSVVFKSDREIGKVIAALSKLKRARQSKSAHFHIQDYKFSKHSGPECAEIVFSRVGYAKDPRNYYRSAVVEARAFLELGRLMYSKLDWSYRKKGAKGKWMYPIVTCRVRWMSRKSRGQFRFIKPRKRLSGI